MILLRIFLWILDGVEFLASPQGLCAVAAAAILTVIQSGLRVVPELGMIMTELLVGLFLACLCCVVQELEY